LDAFGNDPIACCKSLGHDQLGSHRLVDLDTADLDLVGTVDNQDERPRLIELNGALWNQQGRARSALLDHYGHKLSVDQKAIRVGKLGPHLHGIGARIDGHVDEVDLASLRITAAVGKL